MTKNLKMSSENLPVMKGNEQPVSGDNPFEMSRLVRLMHQRLKPSQGDRPGRPTDPEWVSRPKVPMSAATENRLAELAELMSTPGIRISPMQVASQLLEEALEQLTLPPSKVVENPWERLPQGQPYVLPEDAGLVADFNKSATREGKVHLDMLPEPFLGRCDAPVIILGLNPGYTPEGPAIHSDPRFATRARRNLLHLPADYPFYLIDPKVTGPGRTWWEQILRHVINEVDRWKVANGLLCVEFFPYHSERFRHGRLALSSQEYSFALVRDALKRNALVILLRGERFWLRAVPELRSYPGMYKVKNWRKPVLSPRNCPEGYERAIELLRALPQRTVEVTVDPQTLLVEVEELLRQLAGAIKGQGHYRTIILRDHRTLAVDIFDGAGCGHFRVHVFNCSREEGSGIPTSGAPQVPGLLPGSCGACCHIPEIYPAWYPGPKQGSNRMYYGFQWHRPEGCTQADLPLIEECVRWLLQHFPLA